MAPIVVVGEDREGEPAEKAVQAQVDTWLPDVPAGADVVVAYEPAWATAARSPRRPSTWRAPPSPSARCCAAALDDPRVIYGGSAQPGTFSGIAQAAGTTAAAVPDGVFMARFGLEPRDFLTVVREVRECGPDSHARAE